MAEGAAPEPGALADADHVLTTRGLSRALGAHVVAACFDRGGDVAAFALGDGHVRLVSRADPTIWMPVEAHADSVQAIAPDALAGAVVTGGDDGAFRRVRLNGAIEDIARFGSRWVEQVASHGDPKAGLVACAAGKLVHVFAADGTRLKSLEHPSTVTGLAFDAKGKRIGASHYNGVSLWFVGSKTDNPRRLDWKGSHLGIAINPAGDAVVTTMQENALHGWRLSDGQHMRMSGYPTKTAAIGFTRSGKWLASSGADAIVLWPFFAGGPMGKPPVELAGGMPSVCSTVATHPLQEVVAAGFSDGAVLIADIATQRLLPIAAAGRGRVTALAWSPDGATLAFGTETGFAALVDLSR